MWIAKLQIKHKESFGIRLCKRYNITDYVYPLAFFNDKNQDYISSFHTIFGAEENKKKFMRDILKIKNIEEIAIEGDQFVFSLYIPKKEARFMRHMTKGLIFTKPAVIKPDGWEYVEVGAWRKSIIKEFIDKISPGYTLKILKFQKEELAKIVFPLPVPKMSPMQLKVLKLAYELGYYKYPKRINIRELSKIIKLSESTCREHLRIAESKIMPILLENITKHTQA